MKQLTCEMCGSTELMKQDGVFVCQTCGTKYSVEEAKKMMVEGTVDVKGTVKVDQSSEIKNLYELARRAKNDNNDENAQKYYEQLLIKDPYSWEATFYVTYYQSLHCKIAGIYSAAVRLSDCEDTVLQLLKSNVSDTDKQKKALEEMTSHLIYIANMLLDAAEDYYHNIDHGNRILEALYELEKNSYAAIEICYNFGDYVVEFYGDDYGQDVAVPCWKAGITLHNRSWVRRDKTKKEKNENIIMGYVDKIKKYDPSYNTPTVDISGSGCYVATCVYGSYDCPEVWTLRRYRDNTLAESWYGRAFIHMYYAISPTVVKWFGDTEWFKNMWRGKLDKMVSDLQKNGVESTPYKDRQW